MKTVSNWEHQWVKQPHCKGFWVTQSFRATGCCSEEAGDALQRCRCRSAKSTTPVGGACREWEALGRSSTVSCSSKSSKIVYLVFLLTWARLLLGTHTHTKEDHSRPDPGGEINLFSNGNMCRFQAWENYCPGTICPLKKYRINKNISDKKSCKFISFSSASSFQRH